MQFYDIILIDSEDRNRDKIKVYLSEILPQAVVTEFKYLDEVISYMCGKDLGQTLVITNLELLWSKWEGIAHTGGLQLMIELERKKLGCPVLVESNKSLSVDMLKRSSNHIAGVMLLNSEEDTKNGWTNLIHRAMHEEYL